MKSWNATSWRRRASRWSGERSVDELGSRHCGGAVEPIEVRRHLLDEAEATLSACSPGVPWSRRSTAARCSVATARSVESSPAAEASAARHPRHPRSDGREDRDDAAHEGSRLGGPPASVGAGTPSAPGRPARADRRPAGVGRGGRLDHHPHQRLGATRPDEDRPSPSTVPRPQRSRSTSSSATVGMALGDLHVDEHLRERRHRLGGGGSASGAPRRRTCCARREPGEQTVAGGGQAREDDVAALLATERVPAARAPRGRTGRRRRLHDARSRTSPHREPQPRFDITVTTTVSLMSSPVSRIRTRLECDRWSPSTIRRGDRRRSRGRRRRRARGRDRRRPRPPRRRANPAPSRRSAR